MAVEIAICVLAVFGFVLRFASINCLVARYPHGEGETYGRRLLLAQLWTYDIFLYSEGNKIYGVKRNIKDILKQYVKVGKLFYFRINTERRVSLVSLFG